MVMAPTGRAEASLRSFDPGVSAVQQAPLGVPIRRKLRAVLPLACMVLCMMLLGGLTINRVFGMSSVFSGSVNLSSASASAEGLTDQRVPSRATTRIEGDVDIVGTSFNDAQLADLFGGVTAIAGHLRVHGNSRLVDLSFLGNLAVVGGYIDVEGNAGLRNLSGLARVTTVSGGQRLNGVIVRVANNSALESIVAVPLPKLACKGRAGVIVCDVCTSADVNRPVGHVAVPNSRDNGRCVDDDECTTNTHNCATGGEAICINTVGSFLCACTTAIYTGAACDARVGDVVIRSKIDVATYRSLLAGVTVINGSVVIQSSPITAADVVAIFGVVAHINGNLRVDGNAALSTLEGFRVLTKVGGHLYINSNAALTTLEGLRALTRVGGHVRIRFSDALTTLEGLRNVMDIGGYLYIGYNAALTTIVGLRNLASIRGATLNSGHVVWINSNGALTAGLPLSALTCKGSGPVSCTGTPACLAGVVPATRVASPCP